MESNNKNSVSVFSRLRNKYRRTAANNDSTLDTNKSRFRRNFDFLNTRKRLKLSKDENNEFIKGINISFGSNKEEHIDKSSKDISSNLNNYGNINIQSDNDSISKDLIKEKSSNSNDFERHNSLNSFQEKTQDNSKFNNNSNKILNLKSKKDNIYDKSSSASLLSDSGSFSDSNSKLSSIPSPNSTLDSNYLNLSSKSGSVSVSNPSLTSELSSISNSASESNSNSNLNSSSGSINDLELKSNSSQFSGSISDSKAISTSSVGSISKFTQKLNSESKMGSTSNSELVLNRESNSENKTEAISNSFSKSLNFNKYESRKSDPLNVEIRKQDPNNKLSKKNKRTQVELDDVSNIFCSSNEKKFDKFNSYEKNKLNTNVPINKDNVRHLNKYVLDVLNYQLNGDSRNRNGKTVQKVVSIEDFKDKSLGNNETVEKPHFKYRVCEVCDEVELFPALCNKINHHKTSISFIIPIKVESNFLCNCKDNIEKLELIPENFSIQNYQCIFFH